MHVVYSLMESLVGCNQHHHGFHNKHDYAGIQHNCCISHIIAFMQNSMILLWSDKGDCFKLEKLEKDCKTKLLYCDLFNCIFPSIPKFGNFASYSFQLEEHLRFRYIETMRLLCSLKIFAHIQQIVPNLYLRPYSHNNNHISINFCHICHLI